MDHAQLQALHQHVGSMLGISSDYKASRDVRYALDLLHAQIESLWHNKHGTMLAQAVQWLEESRASFEPRQLLERFCEKVFAASTAARLSIPLELSLDMPASPRLTRAHTESACTRDRDTSCGAHSNMTSARTSFTSAPTTARTSFTSEATTGPISTPSSSFGSSFPDFEPKLLSARKDAVTTATDAAMAGACRPTSSRQNDRVENQGTAERAGRTHDAKSDRSSRPPDSKRPRLAQDDPPIEGTSALHRSYANLAPHQISNLPSSGFGQYDRIYNVGTSIRKLEDVCKTLFGGPLPAAASVQHTPLQYIRPEDDHKLILKAGVTLNERNDGPLFKTTLAICKELQSSSLERRFGWHRFMHATITLSPLTAHTRDYERQWMTAFEAWLIEAKFILGRTWRAFSVKDVKSEASQMRTLKRGTTKTGHSRTVRVMFFATGGLGLPIMSLCDFTLATLHLNHSLSKACLKQFARWDILLSRTRPGCQFLPEEMEVRADPVPTTETYEDPFLDEIFIDTPREELRAFDKDEAMTDGVGIISVGAALNICERLQLIHRPTAFQARVFGSKGVWYISAPYDTADKHHLEKWIIIHKSQQKIVIDGADISPAELSFDVLAMSAPPRKTDLKRDFLPILWDRGVPKDVLETMTKQSFEDNVSTWLQAMTHPVALAVLLQSRMSLQEQMSLHELDRTRRRTDLQQMHHWSDHGMSPNCSAYFAQRLLRSYSRDSADDHMRYRIRCYNASCLMGIAVQSDALKPHEVFFSFSPGFENSSTGETISFLETGTPVLATRSPTNRNSDMQLFSYKFVPELAHLKNVVVFSSRGSMPAGAKMQGGDYDGDRYVIIWDPLLTKDFKNSPVFRPRSITDLGIKHETRTIQDIAPDGIDESTCDDWYKLAFGFNMRQDLLGVVTNYLYDLIYNYDYDHAATKEFADIHDWIIDAKKNGYVFDMQTLAACKHRLKLPRNLDRPLWKKSLDNLEKRLTSNVMSQSHNIEEQLKGFYVDNIPAHNADYESIQDYLWFKVTLPKALECLKRMLAAMPNWRTFDNSFLQPYKELKVSGLWTKTEIEELRRTLKPAFCEIFAEFDQLCANKQNYINGKLAELEQRLTTLEPPGYMRALTLRSTEHGYTQWELLRASLLVKMHADDRRSSDKRLYFIAPGPLCYIHSQSEIGRQRVAAIKAASRTRRHRTVIADDSAPGAPSQKSIARVEDGHGNTLDSEADTYEDFDDQNEDDEWPSTSSILAELA